jgi:hypothetical protein
MVKPISESLNINLNSHQSIVPTVSDHLFGKVVALLGALVLVDAVDRLEQLLLCHFRSFDVSFGIRSIENSFVRVFVRSCDRDSVEFEDRRRHRSETKRYRTIALLSCVNSSLLRTFRIVAQSTFSARNDFRLFYPGGVNSTNYPTTKNTRYVMRHVQNDSSHTYLFDQQRILAQSLRPRQCQSNHEEKRKNSAK